jgi:PleD family two-component response regulator
LLVDEASVDSLASTVRQLRADAAAAPSEFTLGCAVREPSESLEAALRRADAALYASRAAARGGGASEKR